VKAMSTAQDAVPLQMIWLRIIMPFEPFSFQIGIISRRWFYNINIVSMFSMVLDLLADIVQVNVCMM
jgi:hypothetical protein